MGLPQPLVKAPRSLGTKLAHMRKPKSLETTEQLFKVLLSIEEKGEVLAAYVGLMGLHTGLRTGGAQCVPQGMWKMLEAAIDRVTKKVNGGKQPLLTALASGWTIVSLLQGTGLC